MDVPERIKVKLQIAAAVMALAGSYYQSFDSKQQLGARVEFRDQQIGGVATILQSLMADNMDLKDRVRRLEDDLEASRRRHR